MCTRVFTRVCVRDSVRVLVYDSVCLCVCVLVSVNVRVCECKCVRVGRGKK